MIDRDGNYEPGVPVSSRKVALGLLRTAMADEFAEFRSGQWEAIEAIASKRGRVLCVQRTGWGKSMVLLCGRQAAAAARCGADHYHLAATGPDA